MRADEFVTEGARKGKISKRQQQATKGLNKFIDPSHTDRFYELNRIMMATACSDGITPIDVPAESWVGRMNTAHPYTEIEQKMLNQAYKAVGSYIEDLNKGDLNSKELDSTNTKSIAKPFKGYKKK